MRKKVGLKVSLIINLVLFIVMACGTFYLIVKQSNSLEAELMNRGKIQSLIGAKVVGRVLEEAVDSTMISLDDVFDLDYQVFGKFEPPKYHTKYDAYLDRAILALEDEFLQDPSNIFAVAVDKNGYLPTHNTRYQQPITGDPAKDLTGNRTKRIFDDPIGLKAAKNTEKGFLQVYHRDTGEEVWDISSPIYVKGKQWGGFRIGLSLNVINAEKRKLIFNLLAIMSAVLVASIILTFLIVNWSLAPVRALAQTANNIADGKKLESEIRKTTSDEIGELQAAIERLRMSMLIALKRGRKM
ncbi:chemotaxis protein [Desulfobulbus sp. Tol-SR]|nr:chemotaxis protein [Desulfobulbus sp. Tol-SR]